MPSKAEGLVLTVDPNVIHKVDTNNHQNLFSLWNVFSRCAESVEQGRRLENLSWRLWNRETFCTKPMPATAATALPKDIPEPQQQHIPEVPQLSGSVDSIADEEAIEFTSETDPREIDRPRIVRQDSCASSRSRGRELHITSDHLEKMVVTIIKEKEPNLSPLPQISSPSIEPQSDHSDSPCSEVEHQTTLATESAFCGSSAVASHASAKSDSSEASPASIVVRGFSPSQIPTLRVPRESKSLAPDAIPEPQSSPAPKPVQPKKQPAKFALGGSSDESSPQSLEIRQPVPPPKKKMFALGGSSGSGEDNSPSLKSAMHSSRPSSLLKAQKKQTSFSNQVTMRTIPTSDQSDSYMDESAIDDDEDDSEWEDSIEESGKSSVDDPMTFKRVPSKTNLTSRRSLISLMFAGQEERSKGLSNYASQSTPAIQQRARHLQNSPKAASPSDSDDNGLEMRRGLRPTPLKPINEIPRSGAQPIVTNAQTHHHQQTALSPRTTRRNMLSTELTESLRRQLLWERQQKTSTANAVLKRRHTSHDVANLKQYPEKAYMNKAKEEVNPSSWNQYIREDENRGYHAQGW
ncbi:Uu.00g127360.m01.CDS01 [Anthostomella pinea]|uniref:Uu.00g127360.m01.CDS01 n=1 Tax=Anthostomella pinea TaxID=933095 RepID=A0AAI8YI07_9PEZI|nr:Uu.00g127360.m01.CDS01 [Anthostomella pinea]